jgi:hypothetical protein
MAANVNQTGEEKRRSRNRERFVRIVENRVNRVLGNLESLGNCSNRRNYEYTKEDVEKIFSEIQKKVEEVKTMFQEDSSKGRKFKLVS